MLIFSWQHIVLELSDHFFRKNNWVIISASVILIALEACGGIL